MKLTATHIVRAINQLPKNIIYHYVSPKNKGLIEIIRGQLPAGPITIRRYNPSRGESSKSANDESISTQMIWRVANAFRPNQPINIDRVLGGSYNTRSVLEALIAHTPQFYFCYPGRIESTLSSTEIKRGHKHIMWSPDNPHPSCIMTEAKTEIVISEVPSIEVFYDSLVVPDNLITPKIDIAIQRRHAQIQVALIMIGQQLGYRTWVAQNDKGIVYKNKKLGELDSVVASLKDERLMSAYEEAVKAALLIDCIWFRNHKLMPAVIEIEHSTGITSGLSRMKNLQDTLPPFPTRYVIVAPDEERGKVLKEANKPQFQLLNTQFFPYSAVEELYALCQRRKIRGVTEEFLDCFMEHTLATS